MRRDADHVTFATGRDPWKGAGDDRFDPVAEGSRHGLSRELSRAIWDRVCADATDRPGRRNDDETRRQFHDLAARIAARGGQVSPDVGRVTRVGVEIDGDRRDRWTADELKHRTPGRETLVASEERRWNASGQPAKMRDGADAERHRMRGLLDVVPPAVMAYAHGGPTVPAAVMRSAERTEIDPEAAELVARARGGGAALDDALRRRLEAALSTRLDGVRVHTGPAASVAARALGARAFAIGNDVFFRDGAYDPQQRDGQRLIAHEVAHTVQTGGSAPGVEALTVSEPGDALEREAEAFADAFVGIGVVASSPAVDAFDASIAPVAAIPSVSTASPAAARAIHRAPGDADSFPSFSQGSFDSCGAASVVSALMIWDKQNSDPSTPNNLIVNACNILLTYLSNYRSVVIAKLEKLRTGKGEALYNDAKAELTAVRDLARTPGGKLAEKDYQHLALVMYLLYSNKPPGMSKGDISGLLDKLGIGGGKTESAQTFDGIFDSAALKGLAAGQIAQVIWYAKAGKPDPQGNVPLTNHVFLIGRFKSGDWFVSDQGSSPPTELIAGSLPALKMAIMVASTAGTSSIFTGTPTMMIVGGFTGVQVLGDRGGVDKAAQVVTPGTFLAEVDAGVLTDGDRIVAWDYVARKYSFNEALAALGGTGANGGLIVEMPQGVFSLYKTNLVSDANLKVTGIDESDSKDGLLARKTFYAAWLILCSKNACRAQPLKVY